MRQKIIYIVGILCFILSLGSNDVHAQGRPTSRPPGVGGSPTNPSPGQNGDVFNRIFSPPDTFDVQYFSLDNPFVVKDEQDTLIDRDFHIADPAYRDPYLHANLGNLGSPSTPLVFSNRKAMGLDIGFHGFDLYHREKEELEFYKLRMPLFNAIFHQGRTQEDRFIEVRFANEFKNGVSFTIDNHQTNHNGVFPNQNAKSNYLLTGFWFHHPKGQYQSFLTFTGNSTAFQENGGIDTASITSLNINQEETFPVIFDNGSLTRHISREGAYTQYYHLRKAAIDIPRDTSTITKFPILERDTTTAFIKDSISNQIDSSAIDENIINSDSLDVNGNKTQADTLTFLLDNEKTEVVQLDSIVLDTTILDSIKIDSITLDSIVLDTTALDSSLIIQDSTKTEEELKLEKRAKKKNRVFYDPNKLLAKKRQLTIGHELSFQGGFNKYSLTTPNADSLGLGELQIYNQGLRYFIGHQRLTNKFSILTSQINETSNKKTQRPNDFLRAGIEHNYHRVTQSSDTQKINNIAVYGDADIEIFKKIKLNAAAKFYLSGYNLGDYDINATGRLSLENIGSLEGNFISKAYAPSIVYQKFMVSNIPLWENNFQKSFETSVKGRLNIYKTKTQIEASFTLIDNFIYFDTTAFAQQSTEALTIPQLIINQPISYGGFHLENTIVLQRTDQKRLPMPDILTRHRLFWQGKLFKNNLLLKVGAEGYFHTEYKAKNYSPLTGQFYNSKEVLDYYPQVDFFLSFYRKPFRGYIRLQNASRFVIPEKTGFRTPNYPIPYRIIRFALAVQLLR